MEISERHPRVSACFAGIRIEAFQTVQQYFSVTSVLTVYDSWVHRYCKTADFSVMLVSSNNKEEVFQSLAEQSTPIVISAGFPFLFPKYVLESGALYINSHPSLLPAYKGRSPIKEAFKNKEKLMGVTVHFMSEEADSGQIICQEPISVERLSLQDIYDLLFGVVEPKTISKALTTLYHEKFFEKPE